MGDLACVANQAVVDVDRFGNTAAVTLMAAARPQFEAAMAPAPVAGKLRLLPGADTVSPALLGAGRWGGLGGAVVAVAAADISRRLLAAKLEQLRGRPGMPP